ncbi:glycosyltransferase family 4 protein [Nitrosarchaeum koreense]|uniref:Putative capsular polysaccharide biosynthesis glycosyl transferase n=1 Tax=Nitrosarchaeum koreense MY1 TaxID=1001994 RepID=F9CY95_9ARCH|nr:glycosyltransferase family 4 protein [Nitrosarchaeum koreense]EGP92873.1 putative capsular polysaccharide biosynthesis glycosyl transferase [Nitrosarchaeum koreense MY1]
MKICIVAPYLASKGGAGRFTWEFSDYLASVNDTVILASLFTDRTIYDEKNNLKIIDLADQSSLTQSIKFWFNLKKIQKKLKTIVNSENPDAILFMNFPATLWAQKFDNKPVLCYPQDINLLYTNTYIKNLSFGKYILWLIIRVFVRPLDKKRWKNFDEIICNSNFSANHISKIYTKIPIRVIHLGTRTNVFKATNIEKKRAFLSIAAQKAQRTDFLIVAAKKMYQKRKDFEVWIAGDSGSHNKELRDLVERLGISDVVKFYGKVSDEELAVLYSKSLAVVHLVRKPPFGMIVTEAMACETPVIACKPGGTEETILDNETGFLIDENNEDALINCLEKFLDNPELSYKMGKSARLRVKQYFEMNEKNREFRDLIQDWIKIKANKN